ncbi:MAG: hypothetical protein ACYCZR_01065 [Burkholderiales bacterium]
MTELTREQVEQLAYHIAAGQLEGYIIQWLDHDAALRARVVELEQERDRWKAVSWNEHVRFLLASLTEERDQLVYNISDLHWNFVENLDGRLGPQSVANGQAPRTALVTKTLRKLSEVFKVRFAALTAERDQWHADASAHLLALCEKQAEVNALTLRWTTEKPSVEGGYFVRLEYEGSAYVEVMNVRDGVIGSYRKPLEECTGWEFAGPIPMPKESNS